MSCGGAAAFDGVGGNLKMRCEFLILAVTSTLRVTPKDGMSRVHWNTEV
jgi:hypothetical protein